MPIPMVDLLAAHAEIAEEVSAGLERVVSRGAFIGGDEVALFESEYAEAHDLKHCVGVASGTDAVELALRAVGVEPGDEVITPANTFIATVAAIHRAGARPVLVDVDPATALIDTAAVEAAISSSTRALIPVHLFGQLAPLEQLREALSHTVVTIVEDGAQSQGARRRGRAAGAGGIAATSFYPGKNLGAYGDAGAVVTDDAELARRVRLLGNHGGLPRYEHERIGFNSRLDSVQAVVLRAKLRRLAAWNVARVAAAGRYDELFADVDVVAPHTLAGNEHVWHLYVVRIPGDGSPSRRDEVVRRLQAAGIGAAVHYPAPVHLTPAFRHLGYQPGQFPVAERNAVEMVSLPIHPHLTQPEQERVAAALVDALRATRAQW